MAHTTFLAGGIASGKSTVARLLHGRGAWLCDLDQVSREVLEAGSPILESIATEFGDDLVDRDTGELNRGELAARAFATPEGTAALTDITQPEILRRIDAALDEAQRGGADLAFVDGAVIVGTPFEARCDALILVTAPYETSVARICARDGIAPEMARRRLDAQTPLETLRAAATAELVNDSTPDALREKLRSVLNGLEKEGTCQKPKSEKEAF